MTTTSSATSSTTTSTASIGSSILNTLGAGSGVDTGSLVTNLTTASFSAKESALTTQVDANTAQISSLGTLTSGIDAFATALTSLISGGTLNTQITSSNSNIVTATTQSGANVGNLSSQLQVRQTAQAQSLVSSYVTNSGSAVGSGSLTLKTASGSYNIAIDSTNNTLSGLARAINAANAGVTASIVTDSNGARLTLKGATGAANAFTLTANSDADTDLSRFTYDPTSTATTQMTAAQTAQDAIIRLDGVDISRASNTVNDVIDGVTLNLISASPGTNVSLSASVPTDAISQAVSNFVSAYNEMKSEIDTASSAPSGSTPAGPLYGNSAIQQMQRQLSRLTSTVLNSSGGPSTLAEIGVSTQLDGSLTLDTTVLKSALANYPNAVEAMFNPTQHSSNPLLKITSAMGAVPAGSYTVTNATASTGSTAAHATIAGVDGITTGDSVYASVTSSASGLIIQPQGSVDSATITVDPGLGGALQAIRDSLRASNGILDALSTSLSSTKDDLATQRTTLTQQESDYSTRLTNQFSSMNTRVSNYKSIQSYLTQQVAEWTKSS